MTLVRVRRTRQQPRWLATLTTSGLARADDRPPATLAVRTFASAVLIGLLLVVGAVAIGGLPSQTPVQIVSPMRADTFIVPFEYDIPAGSALRPVSSWQGRQATAWVEGTDPDSIYGGQTQERSNQHGIIVASAVGTSTHSCTRDQGQGRRALRSAPADFLSDLQLVAGASMGTVETSSIDGHPALISDIDSEGECADGDVHVAGGPPLADYIKLSMPARILTADVDGQPIFVVIWARTSEDLASFMPTANAFVDSIHFLSTSRATPSPSPSPTATDSPTVRDTTTSDSSDTATATAQFVVPFDVTIPAGSALRPASGEAAPEIVAWIEGPDRPLGRRPDGSETDYRYGGQIEDSGNSRGVVVASADTAWAHGCGGVVRFGVRAEPTGFLADLRGSGMGTEIGTSSTLDGRPAQTGKIRTLSHCGGDHVHVNGPMAGLGGGDYVFVIEPARITVAEIDGHTVFVVVWARTQDDLDAFLPTALEFIDSIRFRPAAP